MRRRRLRRCTTMVKHLISAPATARSRIASPSNKGVAVVPAPEPGQAEPIAAPPPPPPAPAKGGAPAPSIKDTKVNWIAVAWQVVTFNLALAVIGFFVYKRWRRGRTPAVSLPVAEGDTQ